MDINLRSHCSFMRPDKLTPTLTRRFVAGFLVIRFLKTGGPKMLAHMD